MNSNKTIWTSCVPCEQYYKNLDLVMHFGQNSHEIRNRDIYNHPTRWWWKSGCHGNGGEDDENCQKKKSKQTPHKLWNVTSQIEWMNYSPKMQP